MKAIIVDDEEKSHVALSQLLKGNHTDVEVLANAYSVQQGYELALSHQPDLVFLDVELTDGLGFDLLKRIEKPAFNVIFITGFNKYAVSAIKFGALDFLLKPISLQDLTLALDKARLRLHEKYTVEQLQIALEAFHNSRNKKLPSRMSISTLEGILYIPVKDIIRLEAQANFTEFFVENHKKRLLASKNIGEYEEQFELYDELMKVHRSHLVNLLKVERFVRGDGNYLKMTDGATIPISKVLRDEVLTRLEKL